MWEVAGFEGLLTGNEALEMEHDFLLRKEKSMRIAYDCSGVGT